MRGRDGARPDRARLRRLAARRPAAAGGGHRARIGRVERRRRRPDARRRRGPVRRAGRRRRRPRAARLRRPRPARRLPPIARPMGAALPGTLEGDARPKTPARPRLRRRRAADGRLRQGRQARPPQNARLRSLPQDRGGRRRGPLRRLAPARSLRRQARRPVLPRAVRVDALDYTYPGRLGRLGRGPPPVRPRRPPVGRPRRRRVGGALADVLREHLQPRPPEPAGDAGGDAEKALGDAARGRYSARPDPAGPQASRGDDGRFGEEGEDAEVSARPTSCP